MISRTWRLGVDAPVIAFAASEHGSNGLFKGRAGIDAVGSCCCCCCGDALQSPVDLFGGRRQLLLNDGHHAPRRVRVQQEHAAAAGTVAGIGVQDVTVPAIEQVGDGPRCQSGTAGAGPPARASAGAAPPRSRRPPDPLDAIHAQLLEFAGDSLQDSAIARRLHIPKDVARVGLAQGGELLQTGLVGRTIRLGCHHRRGVRSTSTSSSAGQSRRRLDLRGRRRRRVLAFVLGRGRGRGGGGDGARRTAAHDGNGSVVGYKQKVSRKK